MNAPRLSATAAAAAIRDGALTSEQLVTDCLHRIAEREDTLRAWSYLDPDLALDQARARDAEAPRGPLHGVPVGIKDLLDTHDQPTTYGSPIYHDHRPSQDAAAVARLRAAGAVIIGKTVTTEFALFQPPVTTHPQDPTRTPGGSSSGSAAAVGAATVPLALGTQTAGSVIRPASFCGVVGAKPTFGAISTDGAHACAPSLDTIGVLAPDVADAALALGVLSGDLDAFRPAELGDRPRIGLARGPSWDALDPTTQTLVESAAQRLAAVADVVEVTLPTTFARLPEAQQTIMVVEAALALADERAHHAEDLSDVLRDYLAGVPAALDHYDDAVALRDRCRAELAELDPRVPLLTPSVLGEAPTPETTGDPLLCRTWTLLGAPAVSVPGLRGPNGLPVGVQVVAPAGQDAVALGAAAVVQQVLRRDDERELA